MLDHLNFVEQAADTANCGRSERPCLCAFLPLLLVTGLVPVQWVGMVLVFTHLHGHQEGVRVE